MMKPIIFINNNNTNKIVMNIIILLKYFLFNSITIIYFVLFERYMLSLFIIKKLVVSFFKIQQLFNF